MFFDIPEFKGFYKISKIGDVVSIHRNGTRLKDKVIKPVIGTNGYMKVSLRCNGIRYTRNIHRLLAQTFIENKDNLPCVNHIDGNKLNNSLSNLEWVSFSKNIQHAYDNGLTIAAKGESRSSLKNEDVLKIVEMKKQGKTLSEISKEFNVSASSISDIVTGRTWSHITNIKLSPNNSKGKKSSTGKKGITKSNNGKFDVFSFIGGKNIYLIRVDSIGKAEKAKKMADELLSDGLEIKQVVTALRSIFNEG